MQQRFPFFIQEDEESYQCKEAFVTHHQDGGDDVGDRKDRHANIGFGTIGFDNLIKVIYNPRLEHVSKILETPYITENDESKKRLYPPYKEEIEMILSKKFDSEMIEKIRNKNKK